MVFRKAHMNILALIPARKGSKRLPDKNIRNLAGKPLIAWTIEAALSCRVAMDVVVSTDADDIAEIARRYGAEVPFLRPASLAGDHATTFDAIEYTLKQLQVLGRQYDVVVLLQPTSPLRKAVHIAEALNQLQAPTVRSVISVSEVEHPIEWTMVLPEDGCLDRYVAEQIPALKSRSQDISKRYRLNGAIFCAKKNDLLHHKNFYMPQGTFAYVMDKAYAVDIDDRLDFDYAEFLINRGQ